MKLLLDTHALLWALGDSDRLPRAVGAMISDRRNELLVSAATAFELATKYRIGKLPIAAPVLVAYDTHLQDLGAIELPISSRHALAAGRLDWAHRDPFDRILVAQALVESVALVSRDAVFQGLTGINLIWD